MALKNFKDWEKIYEAAETKVIQRLENPVSLQLFKIFWNEFMPTIIGDMSNKTVSQYVKALNTFYTRQHDAKLEKAIKFFNAKGYKQPSNKVLTLQKELMSKTDVKTFTTKEGKESKFDDGVFGAATSMVLIDVKVKKLQAAMKKSPGLANQKMSQFQQRGQAAKAIKGGAEVQAAKTKTAPTRKIGVGTQTLKGQE